MLKDAKMLLIAEGHSSDSQILEILIIATLNIISLHLSSTESWVLFISPQSSNHHIDWWWWGTETITCNLNKKKMLKKAQSSPSEFESINSGRQEGSCIIALAKSISSALLLSISSVSGVINLQLRSWYHVTMWDCARVMWSQCIDIVAEVAVTFFFFVIFTRQGRLRSRSSAG